MAETIGIARCDGRDPEDGEWYFDGTGDTVNGYDIAYETPDRDAAIRLGVPASVLDSFESDNGIYGNATGNDLFTWLCNNSDLFRTDGQSVGEDYEEDQEEDE